MRSNNISINCLLASMPLTGAFRPAFTRHRAIHLHHDHEGAVGANSAFSRRGASSPSTRLGMMFDQLSSALTEVAQNFGGKQRYARSRSRAFAFTSPMTSSCDSNRNSESSLISLPNTSAPRSHPAGGTTLSTTTRRPLSRSLRRDELKHDRKLRPTGPEIRPPRPPGR